MDKGVYVRTECDSAIEKDETMPFAVIWMDLETLILSQSDRERQILYDITHACMHVQSLQSCLTLCDPVVYSPPGSPVREILQAGVLEWVAMLSSRGSSWPRD